MSPRTRASILLLVLAVLPALGLAQSDERRQREVARRFQLQIQKLNADNAQLQQEKANLEKDNAELKKKVKSSAAGMSRTRAQAKQEQQQLQEELTKSASESAQLRSRLADLEGKLQALSGRFDRSEAQGRALDGQVRELKARLEEQRQIIGRQVGMIDACTEKNTRLYQLNVELLDKYRSKGVSDALLQAEPFTQIKRIELDNVAQEYKDKLDQQRVESPVVRQP
jgi:predicted  nucleic acid-binding Zn-ribbon protein